MAKAPGRRSAGLLLFRGPGAASQLETLIAHPGGPFFRRRQEGAWTIPKGLIEPGEDELAAARREFREEVGLEAAGPFAPLGEITQKGGKRVVAWAAPGDLDPRDLASGTFRLEWPPRSGQYEDFPEIDELRWAGLEEARRLLLEAQTPFLDRLLDHLRGE